MGSKITMETNLQIYSWEITEIRLIEVGRLTQQVGGTIP